MGTGGVGGAVPLDIRFKGKGFGTPVNWRGGTKKTGAGDQSKPIISLLLQNFPVKSKPQVHNFTCL